MVHLTIKIVKIRTYTTFIVSNSMTDNFMGLTIFAVCLSGWAISGLLEKDRDIFLRIH